MTAGLKWPPETWPTEYIATVTAKPETIAMPIIVIGNFSFTRAAPQPANIRMYVPTNSAIAYTRKGEVRKLTLITYT